MSEENKDKKKKLPPKFKYLYIKKDFSAATFDPGVTKDYFKFKVDVELCSNIAANVKSLIKLMNKKKNDPKVQEVIKNIMLNFVENNGDIKFHLNGTSQSKAQLRISAVPNNSKALVVSLQETNGLYIEKLKDTFDLHLVHFAIVKSLSVKHEYYERIDKDIVNSSLYASALHLFKHSY